MFAWQNTGRQLLDKFTTSFASLQNKLNQFGTSSVQLEQLKENIVSKLCAVNVQNDMTSYLQLGRSIPPSNKSIHLALRKATPQALSPSLACVGRPELPLHPAEVNMF
jgi:hypothetical protein